MIGPIHRLIVIAAIALGVSACGKPEEKYAREVLHAIDQGKLTGTKGTMVSIGRALAAYAIDRGGYPAGGSVREMLGALSPAFLPLPQATDAWGNEFHYRSDTRTYTLISPGADGRVDTKDDVALVEGRFTRLPGPAAQ